jgi:hypothetical protein
MYINIYEHIVYVVRNTKKYSNNIIIRYYIIRQCQKNVATTIYVFLFQNLDSALLNGQPFQGGVDENHLLTASPGVSTRHERVPARYVRAARSVFRVMPTSVWGFGG